VGFVFGALDLSGRIDVATTERLVAACGDAPVTFHKAFDAVRDLPAALEDLAALGVRRVLTSGGAASASEGAGRLAALVRQSAGRVAIMAGGGVRAAGVRALLAATGVREVHARAMRSIAGADGQNRDVTSPHDIAMLLRACRTERAA
jgi:copper homeostasis protein